ncbi:Teichuronic acid biosynthesis protein TuaB [Acaryochloris thomasi RCC1774]|uniref:Teichuronic acid biosynthesis protein TuaB n=1 Tax=Acaryochloris thomasi RCC1774 TaxID=1764569 RepID=A0A2W1JSQ1_9CYAN|nr:lipopolysaccharide biosynthesis protein [Acaryochloris thomasi]PZD71737.1 Teichuronic acid biosynthesis protein TuaB [Acaryochloris thomasi RCC1774]
MSHPSTHTKYSEYFNTSNLKADLKERSIRSGAVTITSQWFQFVLRMGSTVFLARLLSPEDYGLIGMVAILTGFVQLFKDLGLSAATVQKKEVDHQQVSTLFWINLGVSCLVAFVVAALAPILALFYQEPRLLWVTLALSTNFIFGGLTVQHQALMRRQMQFTNLARIGICSVAVGLIVSITMAWLGAGYWALVGMQSASSMTTAVFTWIECKWRPERPTRRSDIRDMLAFGGNLTGFRTLNYFSRNLDNLLIGRFWGATELGLYAKAYQLVLLPIQQINSPVNNVAMPTLSSLQDDPERYSRYYYKAILLITSLGMPIVAFMFASSDKLILLLLGERWIDAVPIFRLLIPAAYIATFNVATGWVYQSLGRTDRQLRWGVIGSILNALVFMAGVRWGAIGVAAVFGMTRPLFFFPAHIYCFQGTPIKFKSFLSVLARPTIASIGAAGLLMVFHKVGITQHSSIGVLLLDIASYIVLYPLLWIGLPNGRRRFMEILGIFSSLRKKRKKI